VFNFSFLPQTWDIDTLSGLAALQFELSRQATMIAYNSTFFAVSMLCFSAIPLVWLFNRYVGAESKQS
jgi:DHA2 family multidrug resistance protein